MKKVCDLAGGKGIRSHGGGLLHFTVLAAEYRTAEQIAVEIADFHSSFCALQTRNTADIFVARYVAEAVAAHKRASIQSANAAYIAQTFQVSRAVAVQNRLIIAAAHTAQIIVPLQGGCIGASL